MITKRFWYCNCEEYFIHCESKCQCLACGCTKEDGVMASPEMVVLMHTEWQLDEATFQLMLKEASLDESGIPF